VIEVYRDNICNVDTEIDDLQSLIGEFLEAREKITEITSKARRGLMKELQGPNKILLKRQKCSQLRCFWLYSAISRQKGNQSLSESSKSTQGRCCLTNGRPKYVS
jgi:hypothetical protein